MEIEHILSQMTLEQKARFCSGLDAWNTVGFEELGVPSVLMTDGPHGLRKQYDMDAASFDEARPATCFPPAATTACSWDRALLYEMGQAISEEARSEGVSLVLGPGINIKRSPLCGRNFEYFSEDPFLSGQMGAALVNGLQSTGTGACLKHFAANNCEHFRMVSNSIVDERALREIYLRAFEIALQASQPKAIMSAYNRLNGSYCGESKPLIDGILRREWKFRGVVISDWGACYRRPDGIAAGMDLDMPYGGQEITDHILQQIKNGTLQTQDLDACVRRLLRFVQQCTEDTASPLPCDFTAHHDLARKAARESAVLLKNQDQLLPLKPDQRIALIGIFAEHPRYQGAGSSQINPLQLETLQEEFVRAGIPHTYAQGFPLKGSSPQLALQALEEARNADVAVIVAGLPPADEAEGMDRTHMRLPEAQIELIRAIASERPTVVILQCGAPVELPFEPEIGALLHSYLGGEAGASALCELLTGKANPCGKLAESYPINLEDVPNFSWFNLERKNAEYRESVYVGYRYYTAAQKEVRYPFGFGLSYTQFKYADFSLSAERFEGTPLTAQVTVTNTGDRFGGEIAQLYVQQQDKPYAELRGFEKVFLQPSESKTITFALGEADFSFYDNGWKRCRRAIVSVGTNCLEQTAEQEVEIADGRSLTHEYPLSTDGLWSDFPSLFEKMPRIQSDAITPLTINATLWDLTQLPIGRLIYSLLLRYANKLFPTKSHEEQQYLIQLAQQNPFRVLVTLSAGKFTFGMARGALLIVNGKFFVGAAQLMVENHKRKKNLRQKAKKSKF